MCYSDEDCTTTCPAARKRRDAFRLFGLSRRDTSDANDDVEYQDNNS